MQTMRCVLIGLLLCLTGWASAAEPGDRLPNIVIIYIDDMGYADIGPFGGKIPTPNLDRLAKEGTRFTSFYSAQAVCSASRAALLTGCYPNRIGIHGALHPNARHGISDQEMTLAELCKQKNYATAIFGKWHLGHLPQFLPTRHGFDEYFGLPYSNDMWPHRPGAPKDYPPLPLLEQDKVVNPDVDAAAQSMLTTQYTQKAVSFIERNKHQPFLLYVPHTMVHIPLYVSDKFKGKSGSGLYGDVVMEIDWSVGEILGAIQRNGLDEHTLVMFSTDNGPWLIFGDHAGSAGPLREGKGTSFDGGVRVPTLMRWPGRIPAGKSCDVPMMTIDVVPTVARLIGGKLPEHKIDGVDVTDIITGKSQGPAHDVLYFYFGQNNLEALRAGQWKLELPRTYKSVISEGEGKDRKVVKSQPVQIVKPELYDLDADPGQTRDLASSQPEVMKKLLEYAEQARADLGDNLTKRQGPGRREAGMAPGGGPKPGSKQKPSK